MLFLQYENPYIHIYRLWLAVRKVWFILPGFLALRINLSGILFFVCWSEVSGGLERNNYIGFLSLHCCSQSTSLEQYICWYCDQGHHYIYHWLGPKCWWCQMGVACVLVILQTSEWLDFRKQSVRLTCCELPCGSCVVKKKVLSSLVRFTSSAWSGLWSICTLCTHLHRWPKSYSHSACAVEQAPTQLFAPSLALHYGTQEGSEQHPACFWVRYTVTAVSFTCKDLPMSPFHFPVHSVTRLDDIYSIHACICK